MTNITTKNELYPIFLKTNQLNFLIIGGGGVAYEKLSFLLKSSPNSRVTLIASKFSEKVILLAKKHQVLMTCDTYKVDALKGHHIVIAATNDKKVNRIIFEDAKALNLLINVADTPDLCDFYLGGIVTKGNVKIAISTNGNSPTLTKRLRQFFEKFIPDNIDLTADNLNKLRDTIGEDLKFKVNKLNKLTELFLQQKAR